MTDWKAIDRAIIAGLDVVAEYRALSLRVAAPAPNEDGWLACHAIDRQDADPSAGIHVTSGCYRDFAGDGLNIGLFEFAARFGPFSNWREARRHYAGVAGVSLPGRSAKGAGDVLRFAPWAPEAVGAWCLSRGSIDPDVVLAAGGRIADATWPRPPDGATLRVLALPAFADGRPDSGPSGYAILPLDGSTFPPTRAGAKKKILTTPGSRGGLMNVVGLAQLGAAEIVWKVEGVSDMLALASAIPPELRGSHVVLTSSGGCMERPRDEWIRLLAGRRVHVVGDADRPGRAGAARWTSALAGSAASAVDVPLPFEVSDDHGKDLRDYLNEGHTYADLLAIAEATAPTEPAQPPPASSRAEAERKSAGAGLLDLAASATLFHDPGGRAFAAIPVNGHVEVHPIKGPTFRRWLTREFYAARGGPPPAEALQAALGVLEARAEFDGPTEPVFTRVAGVDGPDGPTCYLDLCNERWEVVEVTRRGWKVLDGPAPVKFRRAKGMLPLPKPARGGSLDELREFINIGSEDDWRLFVGCMTMALRPRGPYPIVAISGEQGSAKSTTSRIYRGTVDPHVTTLRCEPREVRDLMIAATNAWVVALDNVSSLPAWQSDALCRLATGGGFATRTLYENDEETHFEAMRPVLLNGIEDVATRFDLLDRCVVLSLPAIPDDARREEGPFWREFEAAHPQILGSLLDAVAGGLRELSSVRLDRLPRMADFARWGEAVGRALGWKPGAFLAAYEGNRRSADEQAVEGSPVATAVRRLVDAEATWEGSATDLLNRLGEAEGEKVTRGKDWPKTGRGLSGALRRIAPALRKLGVSVAFDREAGGRRNRVITIALAAPESKEKSPSRPSRSSHPAPSVNGTCHGDNGLCQPEGRDGCRDGRDVTRDDRDDCRGGRASDRPGGVGSRNSLPSNELFCADAVLWDDRDGRDGLSPSLSGPVPVEFDEEVV